MLKMSDTPIRGFLPFFANVGLQVAFLVPTPTGYQKSIMDATLPLREMLREAGIHNYAEQKQGPKFKALVKTYYLAPDRMIETEASLYRPITKQGDPRIWFYNLKQYCVPCNLLAVLANKGNMYVLNLSNEEIVESMNSGFIREVIQQFVDDDNAIAKELLAKIQEIHNRGFLPSITVGDPGVGDTLENALGISRNPSKLPDYKGMSSTSVYNPKHMNTVESDFDGYSMDFVWCDRKEFPYEQIKRQAEYALWQKYPRKNWMAVRYPFAIGKDDYTKRLLFYVEHVIKSEPMYIDNIDYQMSYIRSDEAGEFIAYLVDKDVKGAINGSASETISLREVINYIEEKTGKCAVLSENGEEAPYNGEPEYSINTDKAEKIGYHFSNLKDWIYELLDYYIEQVNMEN